MKSSKAKLVTGLGAAALATVLLSAVATAEGGRKGHGWHRGDQGQHGNHAGYGNHRGHGRMHRLKDADADRNGEVTLEEVEAMRAKRFAEFDADGDGSITQTEMVERAKVRVLARAMRRIIHHTTRKMGRLDKDRDGNVTLDEFNMMAKKRFAWSDLNSDGKINGDELPDSRSRGRGKRN